MSRVRPLRVKGEWKEEEIFSPIPIKILSGLDFFYGPTETKKLSDIWSRHKLAWLWTVVYEAVERDGALVYHAALEMIDEHGDWLDQQKDEKEWPKILRGYRWQRGIVLPGERKGDEQMTIAQWKKEESMGEDEHDFVLTAHDSVSCGGESPLPTWHMMEVAATELDALAADEAQASAMQAELIPNRWRPPGS